MANTLPWMRTAISIFRVPVLPPGSLPVSAYTGGYDAFAARLDSGGVLHWNTFLGGSGDDTGYAVAVDGSENLDLTGTSDAAWGAPVRDYTLATDAFIAKLPAPIEILPAHLLRPAHRTPPPASQPAPPFPGVSAARRSSTNIVTTPATITPAQPGSITGQIPALV